MFYVFSSFIVITQLQKMATNQANDSKRCGGRGAAAMPLRAVRSKIETFIKATSNVSACAGMHILCSRLIVKKTSVCSPGVAGREAGAWRCLWLGDTPVPPKMVGPLHDTSLTAEQELQLNVSTETSLLENFNVLISVF